MKGFSYDFNLPTETQLAKLLNLAGTKRKFPEVANDFILALKDEIVQGMADNEKVVGRFLAVRHPVFTFFLISTLSENVLPSSDDQNEIKKIVEKAFTERDAHLEEVTEHCHRMLGLIAIEDEDLNNPANKRKITNLAKDVFTLKGSAIEKIVTQLPDKISKYFKEAIDDIYINGLGVVFSQKEDSRDATILAFSFVGSNLPSENLYPRLDFLKDILNGKQSCWEGFSRNLKNIERFCYARCAEMDNYGWDAVNQTFTAATNNRNVQMVGRVRPGRGYTNMGYNSRPAYGMGSAGANFSQNRGYGSLSGSVPQDNSDRIMVKVDYKLLRTETNDSLRLEVMLSAIDYLIGFKTNGERNVYSLSSLVRHLNLKADSEAMSIIIATFIENEYLLNKSELYLACASLLPWIPEVILDNSSNPRVMEYNAFRNRIERYVENFNQN